MHSILAGMLTHLDMKALLLIILATVLCANCQEQYRLVDGPTSYEGRIEVFHDGVWGTVCDDYFTDKDAHAFCRFLGMPGDSKELGNLYGAGSGQIWLDNVGCEKDAQTIADCPHGGWGIHNCQHSTDQSIRCAPYDILYKNPGTEGQFRLRGGPTKYEGRVEVRHNGQWGTVCDDLFGDKEARAICLDMGLDVPAKELSNLYQTANGSGEIFLDNIQCLPNALSFDDCTHNAWGQHNCKHSADISIRCLTPDCPPGQYSTLGAIPCQKCERGYYQEYSGQTSCTKCPPGETTYYRGSYLPVHCYPPGQGINDPHFMITDASSKEHLCFDYSGQQGDKINLIEDKGLDLQVIGTLFAPYPHTPDVTYFSSFDLKFGENVMKFNKSGIFTKSGSIDWIFDDEITVHDVTLRLIQGNLLEVGLKNGEIELLIRRNDNPDFTNMNIFVGKVEGFSRYTDGVIGQFIKNGFKIMKEGDKNYVHIDSRMGRSINAEVKGEERFNPMYKGNVACWLYQPDQGEEHQLIPKEHIL